MERREFILSAAMSRKMLCTVAGALALAFFGCSSADKSAEADVRVSPDGAVRTLQAAVDAVRELRASGRILPGRTARIAVAPGTYRLEKTLEVAAASLCAVPSALDFRSTMVSDILCISALRRGA